MRFNSTHTEKLADAELHDEVFGEYMAEGTTSTLVMIRRGAFKFVYAEADTCMLLNLQTDPRELNNLADDPAHKVMVDAFKAEVALRWDLPAIDRAVLASQRRRRLVDEALKFGRRTPWDHQPFVDASQQFIRKHIDLDDMERRARYPRP